MMQAVQLIIERLKTNPEDFFGDVGEVKSLAIRQPKFQSITTKLDDLLLEKNDHPHRLWYLTDEEKTALIDAYREARRARFEAQTFHTLLTNQEEREVNTVTQRYHPSTGKALMQASDLPYESPTKLMLPPSLANEARKILNQEFDKQYAKNRKSRS